MLHGLNIIKLFLLTLSFMLVACGGVEIAEDPLGATKLTGSDALKARKLLPFYVDDFKLAETFDPQHKLTTCRHNFFDDDGFIAHFVYSKVADDAPAELTCSSEDQSAQNVVYLYDEDRFHYITEVVGLSGEAYLPCEEVDLNVYALPVKRATFQAPASEARCTPSEAVQTSLENSLYLDSRYLKKSFKYIDAGVDGEWGTQDDVLGEYLHAKWSDNMLHSRESRYSGTGPDGLWQTEDDQIQLVIETEYSTDGLPTLRYFITPGPDQTIDSPDDIVIRAEWDHLQNGAVKNKQIGYFDENRVWDIFGDRGNIIVLTFP